MNRKLLSILLALALLVGLLPMAALADAAAATEARPAADWNELGEALAEGGDIVLMADVYYIREDATPSLTVPAGVTASLDLNGFAVCAGGDSTDAPRADFGLTVLGSLTLSDSALPESRAWLTGADVAGVYVPAGGEFSMTGGEIGFIGHDTALHESSGAGVWVDGGAAGFDGEDIVVHDCQTGVLVTAGAFTMAGGEITVNNYGVRVEGGSFTMTGGLITGNTWCGDLDVDDGVGVYVARDGEAAIGGTAEIRDNEYEAVVAEGTLTMSGGELRPGDDTFCTVFLDAGAEFTMSGGDIYGGFTGVYVYGAAFTMTAGADGVGGTVHGADNAVYICDGGSFTLAGGALVGPEGRCVGVELDGEDACFTMTGGEIREFATGVQIYEGSAVVDAPEGAIRDCSYRGIALSESTASCTFTDGSVENNFIGVEVAGGSFVMDGGVISDNDEAGVTVVDYSSGGGGGVMLMSAELSAEEGEDYDEGEEPPCFTMRAGSIERNAVGVALLGGYAVQEGGSIRNNVVGVDVYEDGLFTSFAGVIEENTEAGITSRGGVGFFIDEELDDYTEVSHNPIGIRVLGGWADLYQGDIWGATVGISIEDGDVFVADDCEIDYNTTGLHMAGGDLFIFGGDIYFNDDGIRVDGGEVRITGDAWIDCNDAAGVWVNGGAVTVDGGGIEDNGCGIFLAEGSLNLFRSPAFHTNDGGGILLAEGKTVTVDGELRARNIPVATLDEVGAEGRVITEGLPGNGELSCFSSAMDAYHVELDADGEVRLMPGGVTLSLTLNGEALEEGDELTVTLGHTITIIAALEGYVEGGSDYISCINFDENVAEVTPENLGGGVWSFTVKGIEPDDWTYLLFVADSGQRCTVFVGVEAGETDLPVFAGGGGGAGPAGTVTVDVNGESFSVPGSVAGGVLTVSESGLNKLIGGAEHIDSLLLDTRAMPDVNAVQLPGAAAKALAEKLTDGGAGLVLLDHDGALGLNAPAVKNLQGMNDGDMRLALRKLNVKDLNGNQQVQVTGLNTLSVLRANVSVGGQEAHELGEGGEAILAANDSRPEGSGHFFRAAYLDPNATELTADAQRKMLEATELQQLPGGRFLSMEAAEGKPLMFRSATVSEYVIYATDECPRDDSCPLAAFSDLDVDAWYHDGVHFVLDKGWMQGYGDGVFDPNGSTTRAMAVTLLWNMEGRPGVNYYINYADVSGDDWFVEAVRWASSAGIVEGWTDDATGAQVFAPNELVTREQFAAMLYRYAQSQGKGFRGMWMFLLDYPDASDVSSWASEAMHWLVMHGVINGMDGKLNPQGTSTRAQLAAMVQRFAGIE